MLYLEVYLELYVYAASMDQHDLVPVRRQNAASAVVEFSLKQV